MRSVLAMLLLLFTFAAKAATPATVLVLGDSLSAGYGLDAGAGWVALLQQKLKAQQDARLGDWTVVNASVSGDTTAGGLARLPEALQRFRPAVVLIELGGNDGLRGQPVAQLRANLEKLVQQSRAAAAQPVLFEMMIPSNYGPDYTRQFTAQFGDVARATKTPLVPFFLQTVAADPGRWFQDDGIHPNAQAQPLLLEAAWPSIREVLLAASVKKSHP